MRAMLRSKIHRAHVTDANIDYEGSVAIDRRLMEAADILPYERVDVLNINNGARFATYAIEGGKGEICLNGAAARLVLKGDIVLILAYSYVGDEEARSFVAKLVYVDEENAITSVKQVDGAITI
ncbi:aspartate 1-decarboxylase [Chloroflexota bacterium]